MNTILCKIATAVVLIVSCAYVTNDVNVSKDTNTALKQLDSKEDVGTINKSLNVEHQKRNNSYVLTWMIVIGLIAVLFSSEVSNMFKKSFAVSLLLLSLSLTGCWRPFEPIKLEVIQPNEEAFLLPYVENVDKQTSTHTEEFLRKNLVYTQQVKIPQQWVPKGFETLGPDGEWRDAAILIKINKSPVTREWTADQNSGTSTKNEAIWVMTSDQVEFSTGWTCTARISSRDDAVKFLYNYPNGSLTNVMDGELRAKLQAAFGLEVTDLPMTELRLQATPHILKVVNEIKEFFSERGVTITNLGITGGFVYKDPTIIATMVKVFNAEQERAIAVAGTNAQTETNKKVQLEADSKTKALLTQKEGEAAGIKLVADAKAYEIDKAKQDLDTYLKLKALEIEKSKWEKWDGKFPNSFMSGSEGLNILLNPSKDK